MSSVAFTIANAGLTAGLKVSVFLTSTAIDLVRRGGQRLTQVAPLDALAALIAIFQKRGGTIWACPPCVKSRGYEQTDLIDGGACEAASRSPRAMHPRRSARPVNIIRCSMGTALSAPLPMNELTNADRQPFGGRPRMPADLLRGLGAPNQPDEPSHEQNIPLDNDRRVDCLRRPHARRRNLSIDRGAGAIHDDPPGQIHDLGCGERCATGQD